MNTIKNIPPDSKVWVYQSNRKLTDSEVETISNSGLAFIEQWAAHGASLKASFDVLYNRFIILSVDEKQAMASGCSIDSSIRFIKEIEKLLNINLFDRLQVAYRSGNEIISCSLSEFEKLAEAGSVNESTIVFNNMVTSKADFDTKWEVPLNQSWQNRVLA